MSTVAATNLKNASSSVNNAVTTSGGDLTNAAGVSFMGGSKNLLYNGAMQVAQRSTSVASITTAGYHTADRWDIAISALGTWTQDIQNDAPTGSGLRRSLRMLCTTADASPAASDYLFVRQHLEGQDLQRIAKGTASAQQMTLSFWVKTNVAGTYVVTFQDADNSRWVSGSYSVAAGESGTWVRRSITIPADATGAFDNDNALSFTIYFGLGAGSDRSSGTLQTAWGSLTLANTFAGQTNLAAATNNYWQVTGVQLEVGPVATSFEFKSYGQELRECQRYYYVFCNGASDFQHPVHGSSGTGNSYILIATPANMRTAPTQVVSSGTSGNYGRVVGYDTSYGLAIATVTGVTVIGANPNTQQITVQLDHGSMAGTYVHRSYDTNAVTVSFALSAEL